MAFEQDYRLLGVTPGAAPEDIKRAYRKKAKSMHPDVNPTDGAGAAFMEINEAYERLVNDQEQLESQIQPEYWFLYELLRPETQQERALKYAKLWQEEFRTNNEVFKHSWTYLPVKIFAYSLWILAITLSFTFLFGPPVAIMYVDVFTGVSMLPIMLIGIAFLFGSYQFKQQMNRYL